jgi:phenylacetate-CoA ligase
MGFAENIYSRLPRAGQDLAASAFGVYRHWLRFGHGYDALLTGYRQREFWSREALTMFEQQRLVSLLTAAAAHVPHYRETWSAEEKSAARAGRLTDLPLLSKDPIRAAPDKFARDDRRPRPRFTFNTSGSSGTPISTYWTASEVRESRALREARSGNWAGTSFREGRATFSGRMVVPNPNSTGPFHRFNRAEDQVYFSAFHLSARTAPQYVEALRRHRTQWLTGYAVSYYLLARHILDLGLEVPPLKAVITTSEKVTPQMRAVMEQAYRCRVFEEYSTVENAVFASECEHGRLHVSTDSGLVEILRPDGSPCGPGESGEVVATSFVRQHQPFIRYRLGDMAAWDDAPCPCGRQFPVLKEVLGRMEDVVVGPDGRQMVRFHGIFVGLPAVVEGQIVQETLDRIRVKVVPGAGYADTERAEIASRIRQRLGDVQVVLEEVTSIPRTKAGKFKAVVSLLNAPSAE